MICEACNGRGMVNYTGRMVTTDTPDDKPIHASVVGAGPCNECGGTGSVSCCGDLAGACNLPAVHSSDPSW